MTGEIIVALVVAVALVFDFTNGFHDTANSMATTIATRALKPKIAVTTAAILNFVGAFISIKVAATVATGIVDSGAVTLTVIFSGLVGAIAWNLLTWWFGIPSSSSHALIGGMVGATLAAVGSSAVQFHGLATKVLIPAVIAPVLAGLVAAGTTFLVYRLITPVRGTVRAERAFRWAQVSSSSMIALAHGTNDAQKTMGVISLALIANGSLSATNFSVPTWVIVSSAAAIALGTYTGGWRIIKTLGTKVTEIRPAQGFSSEEVAATVILVSSNFGYPLSTTQVVTGAVTGSGVGRPGATVDWSVAKRIATGWLLTLPAAAATAAAVYAITLALGGDAVGPIAVTLVLAISCYLLWRANKASQVVPEEVAVLPQPAPRGLEAAQA